MEEHRSKFRVVKMAKILNVSKNGFYAYLNRPKSNRKIENDRLLEKIKAIHKRSYGIYGYPRITKELQSDGAPVKTGYID
jgi:SMC interacting uncharacterized protein involved in chromosome segregation